MTDPRTINVYDAKADEYANLTGRQKPDKHLQAFIDLMPSGARVLDVGCGPAAASAFMRDAGLRPDPIDASTGMVALANKHHNIGARLATFDEIAGVHAYDGVWANFSLLHASPEALPRHLSAIAKALKPSGVFHIGMKTGAGQSRDGIDRLYTYVGVEELKSLLTAAGLTVNYTAEGKDTGLSGDISPFVICRAFNHG